MLNRRWQELKWLELSQNTASVHFEQEMLNTLLKNTNYFLKQQQNKTTILKASTACQLWCTQEHVVGCISKAAAADLVRERQRVQAGQFARINICLNLFVLIKKSLQSKITPIRLLKVSYKVPLKLQLLMYKSLLSRWHYVYLWEGFPCSPHRGEKKMFQLRLLNFTSPESSNLCH